MLTLDQRLDALVGSPGLRASVAEALRQHHDMAREKIAAKLSNGLPGVEVARLYAAAADELLTALWRFTTETLYPAPNPTEAEKLALIAVGGYGRGVLAPFSDLDIVFLRPWKTTARTETVAEFMLYVLWDLGLKVGSAARSVEEAISLARSDMTIRTALLEARPLAGDSGLAVEFLTRFQALVAASDPRPFIAAKMEEREARHAKAGAVRYRVEPNISSGSRARSPPTARWAPASWTPCSPRGSGVRSRRPSTSSGACAAISTWRPAARRRS